MLLFIDIETVTETNDYQNYAKRKIWAERYCGEKAGTEEQQYYERASIHGEFAKIVCISVVARNKDWSIKKISFVGDDEKQILSDFFQLLNSAPKAKIGGHNVKGFDIPFICKRAIINGLRIPKNIDYGVNPAWKMTDTVDTMEMWKRSGFLSSSLELIALCLGIENPKKKLTGAKVSDIYWRSLHSKQQDRHEQELLAIQEYCEADALAALQIYERIVEPDKVPTPDPAPLLEVPMSSIVPDEQTRFDADLPF